jgi:hypothetical protein
MAKTIVFCADGTWNGPDDDKTAPAAGVTAADASGMPPPPDGHGPAGTCGCEPQLTNVCKLFAWLDGDLLPTKTTWGGVEMEKALVDPSGAPVQVAKYLHGVGNSKQLLDKLAGGAFGVGVTARIARGYTYLSRNYLPGDRIVIVGFSRGAYTARALAGLVAGEGLLRPDLAAADDDHRYDTAAAAWFRWRHGRDTTWQKIVDGFVELTQMRNAFSQARALDDASFVPVELAAVAVWDTVGSLGIPAYHDGKALDLFNFCDTALSKNIRLGLHAVAVDELRMPFQPTLWDAAPNVVQALFPGGHCDVGGGYAEHGLSDIALQWLVDRLRQPDVGVRFATAPPVEVRPDPQGPRHRAWVGSAVWAAAGLRPRSFPPGLAIDEAVKARMSGAPESLFGTQEPQPPYKPGNLP